MHALQCRLDCLPLPFSFPVSNSCLLQVLPSNLISSCIYKLSMTALVTSSLSVLKAPWTTAFLTACLQFYCPWSPHVLVSRFMSRIFNKMDLLSGKTKKMFVNFLKHALRVCYRVCHSSCFTSQAVVSDAISIFTLMLKVVVAKALDLFSTCFQNM